MKLSRNNDVELDITKIGVWPKKIKLLVIIVVCFLLFLIGYYFDFRLQTNSLQRNQKQEQILKQRLARKYDQVVKLKEMNAKVVSAQELYGELLARLTAKFDLPDFLSDISEISRQNILHLAMVRSLSEKNLSFCIRVPIKIVAIGNYHRLAQFISSLANMERIVTFSDISIKEINVDKRRELKLTVTAEIYKPLIKHG